MIRVACFDSAQQPPISSLLLDGLNAHGIEVVAIPRRPVAHEWEHAMDILYFYLHAEASRPVDEVARDGDGAFGAIETHDAEHALL